MPGAMSTHAVGSKPDRSFNDHPDISQAKQLLDTMEAVFTAGNLPNPFFAPHEGKNGVTSRYNGRDLINFGSFSYLGLATDPRVIDAAKAAIDTYGTSVSASRIVAGQIPLYEELEQELAAIYNVDDAVITPSGYSTNSALIGFLLGPGDLAICDSLVHSSAVSGTRWS
ncbi:MAG: aminotransferase class I/II-fold pyridoxal phosphate-dependent enzyme, partial [Rhodococcus sp.]|nr:aminotransferase class I/II-fold pyridoxal phosphate-dependent enzyme [Rhodococcus sp. (in: high G+C Gram-positive bacteria)]